MKLITNKTDFLKLIETENECIVFCFFNWSTYSVISKKVVEKWEKKYNREIILIDSSTLDNENYYLNWLREQENGNWAKEGIMTIEKFSPKNRLHGYGEICWISNQKVIGFEAIYDNFNVESLEKKTNSLSNKSEINTYRFPGGMNANETGILDEIFIKVNQKIKKGEIIAKFSSGNYEMEITAENNSIVIEIMVEKNMIVSNNQKLWRTKTTHNIGYN